MGIRGTNAMAVKPVPEHYHTVTPYLIVAQASDAITFYQNAFGARELFRLAGPDGRVGHAEVLIGDSPVMLADEQPNCVRGPRSYGGSPVSILLYVEDCDAVFNQALAAGAIVKRPLADQFYGDRSGTVDDPFGHTWHIATRVEDLSPEEIGRRARAMMQPPS
jgi:PhnB protein